MLAGTNPFNTQQTGKISVPVIQSLPTTHKWTIAHDLTLGSNPSQRYEYLIGNPISPVEFSLKDEVHIKHARKLKEVRRVLSKAGEEPLEGLFLIDAIQRLGIEYHFQEEIEAILQRQYMAIKTDVHKYEDLYEVSLCFRLLRPEGYYVSPDAFSNFNKQGKFTQELSKDVKGVMGLFEASQLSIEGEDILDEATNFSRQVLSELVTHLDPHQARTVASTLRNPYHKSLGRFMAKNFIVDYRGTNGWENDLQELAKMDFNVVQSIHQRELLRVSKWWSDLGLAKELKLARDQPLKWYMWPMAMLTDPNLSYQRIELTKPISLIYMIDDIFDLYGTLDELVLFTEVVKRWDFSAVEQLPDYMKNCFKALYDTTNEISYNVYKAYGWNPIDSLRETWASLCNAFLVEAKWFASGKLPKAEEYLNNGIVSSGVHVVLVHLFFLLGHGRDKESECLVKDNPGLIISVATILRLWDDLGSAKDENQDGYDGSYVEYYMKEHQSSSVETAREHVINKISDAWKSLNKECLSPNPFSATFKKASLNLARMVPLMYNYDDNHQLPGLEELATSLLYDHVY
ncbi:unnamed protein product [Ilex paraguariensis]|uniref:Uncharacterized protein n=1 Tax=Ilex paraguariensis TaxID=185542 RepID=A0ABC8R8G3_9AQUA